MKWSRTLRRGIAASLIVIVALMPFHAFLSVWLGTISHHETIIEAWKEALLIILTGATAVLLIRDPQARDRLRSWPVALIALMAIIAALVTAFTHPSLTAMAYGVKTDFEFLLAFLLATVIATPMLIKRLSAAVLVPAVVVTVFALLESTVLQPGFLRHFGYSLATVQPYEVLGGSANVIRYPATLGGPNQLGTYLMLPFALSLLLAFKYRKYAWLLLTALCLLASFHTYSRGAWIGTAVAAIAIALVLTPRSLRARAVAVLVAAAALCTAVLIFLAAKSKKIRDYLFHGTKTGSAVKSSDALHLSSLQTGLADTLKVPFGHGIGTAGPAVFHSHSGLIIENNFLQLSYEIGILGALTFIALCFTVCLNLARRAAKLDLAAATLAAIVGVSLTGLFLPAWTDSSTALIVWICAGACVGLAPDSSHV